MKKLISIFTFMTLPLSAPLFAATGASLNITPVVGLERVVKISPVRTTKTRAILGARASYGVPLLRLEAQVTRSQDTETLPERDLSEEEETYTGMLGIRSSFNMAFVNWYLRAGGHARKTEYTRTEADVTTTREPAIYVSPYAGTGLNINVMGNFFVNAGITVIFTGRPKGSDRDYQSTLSFGVKI